MEVVNLNERWNRTAEAYRAMSAEIEDLKKQCAALRGSRDMLSMACNAYRQAIERGDSPEAMRCLIATNDELTRAANATDDRGDAAGEASEVTRLVKILRSAEAIARKLKPSGHMGDEEAGCDRECRACFHDQLMGVLEDALARHDGESGAIPGRAGSDRLHEALTRLLRHCDQTSDEETEYEKDVSFARAALAEMRGGDAMTPHERAKRWIEMMRADTDMAIAEIQKQLAEREAILSQVRSELDAMTKDRDEARRRLGELERAEEIRDAVCEERNMMAKRVAELEAALRRYHQAIQTIRSTDQIHWFIEREIIAAADRDGMSLLNAGKRGGGTVNTAEGEARMRAADETNKKIQVDRFYAMADKGATFPADFNVVRLQEANKTARCQ